MVQLQSIFSRRHASIFAEPIPAVISASMTAKMGYLDTVRISDNEILDLNEPFYGICKAEKFREFNRKNTL